MKVLLLCLLFIAVVVIERGHAAFQCYKCNDCGQTWNPSKARQVLTEGGGNYCTKRVSGTTVTKDYSWTCTPGNGMYCCQDEMCNASKSIYYVNLGVLVLFSSVCLLFR